MCSSSVCWFTTSAIHPSVSCIYPIYEWYRFLYTSIHCTKCIPKIIIICQFCTLPISTNYGPVVLIPKRWCQLYNPNHHLKFLKVTISVMLLWQHYSGPVLVYWNNRVEPLVSGTEHSPMSMILLFVAGTISPKWYYLKRCTTLEDCSIPLRIFGHFIWVHWSYRSDDVTPVKSLLLFFFVSAVVKAIIKKCHSVIRCIEWSSQLFDLSDSPKTQICCRSCSKQSVCYFQGG